MSNQASSKTPAEGQEGSPRSQRSNSSGDENDNPDTSSLGAFLRQLILPRTPKHNRHNRRRNSGDTDSDRDGHESGEDEVLVGRHRDDFDGVEQSGSPPVAGHSVRIGTVGSLNIPDIVPGKVVASTVGKAPTRSHSGRSWWGGSTAKADKDKGKDKERDKDKERGREKEQEWEREQRRQREEEKEKEKHADKHRDKDKEKSKKDKADKKKKGGAADGDDEGGEDNSHHRQHHHHNPFHHHHHHHHKNGEGGAHAPAAPVSATITTTPPPATGAQPSLMDLDFFGPSFEAESKAQLGGGQEAPVLVGAAGDMLFDLMYAEPPATTAGGAPDSAPLSASPAGQAGGALASAAFNLMDDSVTSGSSRRVAAKASPGVGAAAGDNSAVPALEEAGGMAATPTLSSSAPHGGVQRSASLSTPSTHSAHSVSAHSLSARKSSFHFGGVDGSAPVLLEPSRLLSEDATHALSHWLPTLCWGKPWRLLYSTEKHGISLKTLYRKADGPTILVVRDTAGAIFGGFASETWEVSFKYTGTNDCFVFRIAPGPITVFPSTVANRYYMLCREDSLAFGGGGHFALRIDEELVQGSSGPCDTYNCPCLASAPDFTVLDVELWGFTTSSAPASVRESILI